ncbi:sodium-dependent bicarbonate transport family permease [Agarivorans sp. QJM3NY_25]|uniref:sodium-dependent bicarbonate transport family permease n=1 Tax=Agarivorans sp. QJM3NY_25 TaxID=3421430 RepID=UPI003D7E7918
MQIDVVVGFFVLGAFAKLIKSDLKLPSGLYQSCLIFLLLAIGLKGGIALHSNSSLEILPQSLAVMIFGALLPLLAFPILYFIAGWSRLDAAATAAHYGSISVGTYAVAVAYAQSLGLAYEAYLPLFVALLEVPAIVVGILLAQNQFKWKEMLPVLREALLNKGVILLLGGLAIGAWAGPRTASIMPFFGELFHGMLALFLLEMGRVAAERIRDIRKQSAFLISFGIAMPVIGGFLGAMLGAAIGLSVGGTCLLAVLGSSASYIAVPAALAVALPNAKVSVALTASLAITFPFNVLVGIPVYFALIQHWF